METAGRVELFWAWELPATCHTLCYKEIRVLPLVSDSEYRLRTNYSALSSQVVADSVGYSLPVPVWSALSTV